MLWGLPRCHGNGGLYYFTPKCSKNAQSAQDQHKILGKKCWMLQESNNESNGKVKETTGEQEA
jgi:hypothetical protein